MKTVINKVALVTSATRGIGFASALKLAQEGAIVYLGVRRMEDTQEICDRYTELKMIPVYFDAYKEEYVSMVDAGILDPAKVTRSALQNATSVASTLLTTESVVATIKEDAPAMPAGNPGMGMM